MIVSLEQDISIQKEQVDKRTKDQKQCKIAGFWNSMFS